MLNIDDACKIAQEQFEKEKLKGIYFMRESESKFYFFGEEKGKPVFGGRTFLYIKKDNGEYGWFYPRNIIDELDKSVEIEVPEKYKI